MRSAFRDALLQKTKMRWEMITPAGLGAKLDGARVAEQSGRPFSLPCWVVERVLGRKKREYARAAAVYATDAKMQMRIANSRIEQGFLIVDSDCALLDT